MTIKKRPIPFQEPSALDKRSVSRTSENPELSNIAVSDGKNEFSDITESGEVKGFSDIVETGKQCTSPTPDQYSMQCPCCGYAGKLQHFERDWQLRLYELCHALKGHGVSLDDFQAMSIADQHGVYVYLSRLADSSKEADE